MSYEMVSGLGGLAGMLDCPKPVSQDMPLGLSAKFMQVGFANERQVCPADAKAWSKLSGPEAQAIVAKCNKSAAPTFCLNAKMQGMSYLGRGSAQDVKAWQAWVPADELAAMAYDTGAAAESGDDNTTTYVVLALVALAAGGGYYVWQKRRKAKAAAKLREEQP